MRQPSVYEASKSTGFLGGAGRRKRHRFDLRDIAAPKATEKPEDVPAKDDAEPDMTDSADAGESGAKPHGLAVMIAIGHPQKMLHPHQMAQFKKMQGRRTGK